MNLREAAQQALEALENLDEQELATGDMVWLGKEIGDLRVALNQERYVVTGNEFNGAPPEPYANWGDAIAAMIDRGVIQGLRISALADTQEWDELEALRQSLREHMTEIKRLNECLTWEQHRSEHVGTHGPGCAMWGPKHYECLLNDYEMLKAQTSQESRQVEPVAWMWEYRRLDGFVVRVTTYRSQHPPKELDFILKNLGEDAIPLYAENPLRNIHPKTGVTACLMQSPEFRLTPWSEK